MSSIFFKKGYFCKFDPEKFSNSVYTWEFSKYLGNVSFAKIYGFFQKSLLQDFRNTNNCKF